MTFQLFGLYKLYRSRNINGCQTNGPQTSPRGIMDIAEEVKKGRMSGKKVQEEAASNRLGLGFEERDH